MSEDKTEKPKIIIDEDWKSQVQAEREQLKETVEKADVTNQDPSETTIPPASFPLLITSIATQAMMALGQIPDPVENKLIVRLDIAKHHIDTLSILEEKTKGNLTDEESQNMNDMLYQLRMVFVALQNRPDA